MIDWGRLAEYIPAVHEKMAGRPYQITATNIAWGSKRTVIDGKAGSGKTLIALTAALLQRPNRILFLCSKNALHTWRKELQKWYPDYAKHYVINNGAANKRAEVWNNPKHHFVACTYAAAQRDLDLILRSHQKEPFMVLIMDEYQKAGLLSWKGKGKDKKTGKSKMTVGYRTISELADVIASVFPTSGTTIKRGNQQLWPILNVLNPKQFPSYWQFVYRYCVVVNGMFGKEICGPQNTKAMWLTIGSNYHRIPRSETDKYLPPINRQLIPIDMTPIQRQLYEQVDKEMWYELDDGSIKTTSTVLAKITKLRQIMVTPKILYPDRQEWGASAEIMLDMMRERESHHTVIFTPYRDAVTLFKKYFQENLNINNVFHIWGGTEPDELRDTIAAWKATKGLILCTTMFSQSFELDTTDFCFFAGWEPEHTDNEQCEGRVRRTTMDLNRPISAYYLQNRNTYEDRWLEILVEKKQSVKLAFATKEEAKGELRG